MPSTLVTCANTGARPASPALGDTLYQEDTNQIIVCSNATGPVWKTYEANGELAYPSGIYTAGTPYIITTQPDMHYDGSRINGADASGNPAIGADVTTWEDRSGNSRDAHQSGTHVDKGTFIKMGQRGLGVRMPSSTTLGFYDTNHTFASGSDGMTIIVAVTPPNYNYYASVVTAAKTGSPTPSIFADAGIMMSGSSTVNLAHLAQNYYPSSYANTISRQGPRIITVLDGDGDQKVFEGTQVGYTNTVSRIQATIDNGLGGDWFLGEGYQHFGASPANGGGGIYYEVLIFRGLLGYTVDGSGDLNGGEMNTVVNYLANKYGIPATHPYES